MRGNDRGNTLGLTQNHEILYRQMFEEMSTTVKLINQKNGWYDIGRSFGDDIALLHSEVSEMYEAYRNSDVENRDEEAADILIRLLDTCSRYHIDLGTQFIAKCRKNNERPYRHGNKVV